MMQSIFGMPEALDIGPHKFTGMIRTGKYEGMFISMVCMTEH